MTAKRGQPSNVGRTATRAKSGRILWFHELTKDDVPLAGGKGANLGEMTRQGIPVPPGFVVSVTTYREVIRRANLDASLRKALHRLDVNDAAKLQKAAQEAQDLVRTVPMPEDISQAIVEAYHRLGAGPVAVRSSATAEDLPEASFAGQQRTFLNVEGDDAVIQAVKGCWASLFEPRALFYRVQQNFDHLSVGIAVPVQRMVQSEVAGVMFTVEPTSSDPSKVTIESAYGLGEAVVSGDVTPDTYIISKTPLRIASREIARQTWKLVRNLSANGDVDRLNMKVEVPPELERAPKLSDQEILELARIGLDLERAYGQPQDIEWAREKGRFYIVQTRAVTTLRKAPTSREPQIDLSGHRILVQGAGASPGMDFGPVKIILHVADLGKVGEGDVLVTEMTTPDFVPAMKRAAAIVTDKGGRTAHAAIVSRELGIPCVVGTGAATRLLQDGQIVTVDGSSGMVYEGEIKGAHRATEEEDATRLKTRTNVYVNLAEPDLADRVAKRNVDGVGLLRAEFIIARIGEHPRHMLEEGRGEEFVTKLAEGLLKFAAAFDPRPVIYRTTDFKTNEYRNLKGGERFEEIEENPMIGFRGASRYIRDRDVFRLEVEAVKRVRSQHKNLYVMIPFVRTVEEMAQAKALLEEYGLVRGQDGFKLWMMAEVPSNAFLLDQFIDVGIDGVSIGSNDLTQLVLGIDRDNAKFAQEFDERNPAVMMALEMIVKTAKRRGVTCSICGQAPSFFPELTARLVRWGITSVSVSPDVLDKTRRIVYEAERIGRRRPAKKA